MLLDELKTLPSQPGIYQYFDTQNRLLYVGKAKNLKNRVKSYFSFTPNLAPSNKLSPRIFKMISEAVHMQYIVTSSEADALILENSFIKQLKPKYNILLRDDKTYPYIFINLNENFPRFEITRKVINDVNIRYYGPFFSGAREILDALYLNYKLVQKKSCIKGKKSCLFHQIHRCHAPCEAKISKDEYAKIVKDATQAIKNPNIMLPRLSELMQSYAKMQNYEQAATIRDQIQTLKNLETKIEVDIARLENFEAYAVANHSGMFCAIRFSVQNGKISGVKTNVVSSKDGINSDKSEIYKHIILDSFGVDMPVTTTKIYTLDEFDDSEILAEILSQRHGKRFSIQTPKIGEKRKICEIAEKNAVITIQNQLKTGEYALLNEIKEYFSLSHVPNSIEIFDNSHLFGEANVGAFVRYENGEFIKEKYRHIHLKSKNDYEQMKENLIERALRFDKLSPPDLWLIDGGDALLNLAHEILKSSGANVDILAISKEKIDAKAHRAKGDAKDKIYSQKGKFTLPTSDKRLQFLQKLRDEAHRFVISFHRKIRNKNEINSSRLKKLGISEGSVAKLVKFYGNFDKIYTATYDEIARVANKSVADKIFKEKL